MKEPRQLSLPFAAPAPKPVRPALWELKAEVGRRYHEWVNDPNPTGGYRRVQPPVAA